VVNATESATLLGLTSYPDLHKFVKNLVDDMVVLGGLFVYRKYHGRTDVHVGTTYNESFHSTHSKYAPKRCSNEDTGAFKLWLAGWQWENKKEAFTHRASLLRYIEVSSSYDRMRDSHVPNFSADEILKLRDALVQMDADPSLASMADGAQYLYLSNHVFESSRSPKEIESLMKQGHKRLKHLLTSKT
jgi:hypothetical protein